jgi:NFU1 iron-sulfur cluster scaffold homolog, mitochondrial
LEWMEVQHELRAFLKSYIDAEKPFFANESIEKAETDSESPQPSKPQISMLDVKIKQILDEYIKPAVEQDGGAISFVSFHEGIVKVQLQGACSGCPSSTVTLKAGIENLLKTMIPEVETVEAEGI